MSTLAACVRPISRRILRTNLPPSINGNFRTKQFANKKPWTSGIDLSMSPFEP